MGTELFGLTPLVSIFFRGATLTEHDDLRPGAAHLGKPVWNQSQLLRDLELRVGVASATPAKAVRVQRWARQMAELEAAKPGRFYQGSFALDPLGTATTLLAWRDELALGGWNGESIPNGGGRLETLRELELDAKLPSGVPNRLAHVERALRLSGTRPYEALLLAEAPSLWPGRWRRAFALLEELGTPVRHSEMVFPPTEGDSDLLPATGRLPGRNCGLGMLSGATAR